MRKTGLPELATRRAERFVKDEGVSALPVDPIALATKKNIEVVAKPAETQGVSGMLIAIPDTNDFVIAYATHIENEGFKRFSVAHELGHFVLDGHCDHLFAGGVSVHSSHSGFISENKYEVQADHFAAGLLMPRALFEPAMDRAGSGFSAIDHLHTLCKTSITSTAIRYAQLSEEPVAVVMSTGSKIDYWFPSTAFKKIPGIDWLKKGASLPSGTATFEFNKDPDRIASAMRWDQSTSIREWFGDGPEQELNEDIVGLGSYGRTLTVLFADEEWPDAEDGEEEELGTWEPTFHR